mgnify:CR=1 FL=1
MSVPTPEEIARKIQEFKPVEVEPRVISETYHKPFVYILIAPFKEVKISPQGVADVVFHVLSYRLEGRYISKIVNMGLTPIRGLNVTSNLESEGEVIFKGLRTSIGTLRRGEEKEYSFSWTISRGLGTLWALVNIWLSGVTHVKEGFTASAFRFVTEGLVEAEIPVRNIQVAWD